MDLGFSSMTHCVALLCALSRTHTHLKTDTLNAQNTQQDVRPSMDLGFSGMGGGGMGMGMGGMGMPGE